MIMTNGELCILIPNRPINFSDKMRRRPALPRCLFGPPDPAETQKFLQEEIQRERERFQRRWNVDLDALESAIEKRESAIKEKTESTTSNEEDKARIPTPSEVEERLSACTLQIEDDTSRDMQNKEKTSRSSSGYSPSLKRNAVCKKPCAKFQKRVRAAGALKGQTYLTEFWRSRRSMAFVFGKSSARKVTLQAVSELLDSPVPNL